MSSNYWQTKKQAEQFKHGNTRTSKIESYIRTWERRCYSSGIPDEVPEKLAKANRAPSYKSIAIAILSNDHALKGLGFDGGTSENYRKIKTAEKEKESKQGVLWWNI